MQRAEAMRKSLNLSDFFANDLIPVFCSLLNLPFYKYLILFQVPPVQGTIPIQEYYLENFDKTKIL